MYICNWSDSEREYIEGLEKVFARFVDEKAKNRLKELYEAMNKHFVAISKAARTTNKYVSDKAKIYREIIVNQKVPGGGRHPLAKREIKEIPSQHFRTTDEMLNDFAFLGNDLAYEIVVKNTNDFLDLIDEIEVIIDTKGIPFSPRVKSDDGKSYLDCPRVVTDLVYDKAKEWYGDPLPHNIEERISTELYGDAVYKYTLDNIKKENKDISDEELTNKTFACVHKTILEGFDSVRELIKTHLKENWNEEDGELNDNSLEKKLKKELGELSGINKQANVNKDDDINKIIDDLDLPF